MHKGYTDQQKKLQYMEGVYIILLTDAYPVGREGGFTLVHSFGREWQPCAKTPNSTPHH